MSIIPKENIDTNLNFSQRFCVAWCFVYSTTLYKILYPFWSFDKKNILDKLVHSTLLRLGHTFINRKFKRPNRTKKTRGIEIDKLKWYQTHRMRNRHLCKWIFWSIKTNFARTTNIIRYTIEKFHLSLCQQVVKSKTDHLHGHMSSYSLKWMYKN